MTDQQLEQASQKHADEQFPILLDTLSTNPWPDVKKFLAQAYKQGAQDALASQWISVEERLPKPFVDVIVQLKGGAVFIAYHNGEEWIDRTEWKEFNPAFWLPIPQLNPEKEER